MLTFSKCDNDKFKLHNLLEILSLDDENDIDANAIEKPSSIDTKHNIVKNFDNFDVFVHKRILNNDDSELSVLEDIIIDAVNNAQPNAYVGKVIVNDTAQLVTVLQRGVKYFGYNGNFNWINTSNITSMVNLFSNAFGSKTSEFNGDISKWDVSNVRNMLYIFRGCKSLKCDISGWNTSSVKHWSKASYADTNPTLVEICKKLKFPNLVLRAL